MRIIHDKSEVLLDNLRNQGPVAGYLTDLALHHHETHEHSLRVALVSIDLGFENGLPGAECGTLGLAGLLHDLGKTEIDHLILSKESALDADERGCDRSP